MTILLAVFGGDVSGSLSPLIHHAAAKACGQDVTYLALSAVDAADFRAKVGALQTLGASGANVTIPFKADALALCGTTAPVAQAIGAVNTLVFREDGTVEGDNTDGPGMLLLLSAQPEGRLAVVRILGAGGAARAVAWAAREAGARTLQIASRRPEAAAWAEAFGAEAVPMDGGAGPTLVVSCLPTSAASAAWSAIDVARKPTVIDLAYVPGQVTPLVSAAANAGLQAEDGLGLLVEQGALAFARWTGAPLSEARAAMAAALATG